jgi:hypothetical protein
MGLLDWLTSDIGSAPLGANGDIMSGSRPNATGFDLPNQAQPTPTPDMPSPPISGPQSGLSYPPPAPQPPISGPQDNNIPSASAEAPANAGAPVPMPMARPAGANAMPPLPPATDISSSNRNAATSLPPGMPQPGVGMPHGSPPMPPGAPMSLAPPDAASPIGRSLGLDANQARQLRSSLGAAFTAAGNSAGKSPFQAFASGAGAGIEGGDKADDKIQKQQTDYLKQAIAAAQAGNAKVANDSLIKYRESQERLNNATIEEKKNGKDKASVMNTQQQLYLSGLKRVSDAMSGEYQLLKSRANSMAPADYKAAEAALQKKESDMKSQVLGTLGVKEADIGKIEKMPGSSETNPVKVTSEADVKNAAPGTFLHVDGKVYRKPFPQAQPGAAGGDPAAAPAAPAAAPVAAPAADPAQLEDQGEE